MTAIAVRNQAGGSAVAVQQRQQGVVAVRQGRRPAVVAAGLRGVPGIDGVDGATLSPDPGNQIENRPNGLFVPPLSWQSTDW